MRALACVGLLGFLVSCDLYGPCCNNISCAGGAICSVDDDQCPAAGHPKGVCEPKCAVDRDCSQGQVCNLVVLTCGCEDIRDGGSQGTCSPGVGD